jgi:hypothetical protein
MNHPTGGFPVIVIADPEVYDEHVAYSDNLVEMGKKGIGAQVAECYTQAAAHGYDHFVRLDDDLEPGVFVERAQEDPEDTDKDADFEVRRPSLLYVIDKLIECLEHTGLSYAGINSNGNAHWMRAGYSKTYGDLPGCCNLSIASPTPFMDPELKRMEWVYRVCAHRRYDLANGGAGRNGKVNFIGLDYKRLWGNMTSCDISQEDMDKSQNIILTAFSDLVMFTDPSTWTNAVPHNIPKVKYLK